MWPSPSRVRLQADPARVSAALAVQRVWRGLCARRHFTELLLSSLQQQLQQEDLSSERLELPEENAPAPASPRAVPRAKTPSLEEARELAAEAVSMGQFHHPGSPHPEAGLPLLTAQASGELVQPSPSRNAPPSPFLHAASSSTLVPPSPKGGGRGAEARHARSGSGGAVTPALSRRNTSDSDSAPTGGEDLQFTEELAANMSNDALRDLASVLGRLSATRNKVLLQLAEKRAELLHEKEQRQTLVEQLLQQVDKSRGVRKAKADLMPDLFKAKPARR